MIVRILEDGQYEVDQSTADELGAIDARLGAALERGDETAFEAELATLVETVHKAGKKLADDDLRPSDLALPAEGSTLAEVRAILEPGGSDKD